jgi:hypothetical protein
MPNRANSRSAPPTRKQQMHSQRDHLSTRWALVAFGVLFLLIIVVLGAGILQTYFFQKNTPLGTVYGEAITIGQYQQEFRYELWSAMDTYQEEADFAKVSNLTVAQQSFFNQAQSVYNEFQTSKSKQKDVLLYLEQAVIARHEAQARGIRIDEAEVEARIENRFGFVSDSTRTAIARSTLTPTRLPTATATPGGPSPMPSLTPSPTLPAPTATADISVPLTESKYRENYSEFLARLSDKTGMHESEFRARIHDELLIEAVRASITANMPLTQTHVHLQQIITGEEAIAKAAAAQLNAGEDWAAVTRATTIDIFNRDLAGDIGWVPLGNLDPVAAPIIEALKVGEVSPPIAINSEGGKKQWYLFRVVEKGERQVDDSNLPLAQKNFYERWLNQLLADKTVVQMSEPSMEILPKDPKPTK